MDNMLLLLDLDIHSFLFPHVFLHQLPSLASAALANSPCLAEEANRVLLDTRQFSARSVASESLQMVLGDTDLSVVARVTVQR